MKHSTLAAVALCMSGANHRLDFKFSKDRPSGDRFDPKTINRARRKNRKKKK